MTGGVIRRYRGGRVGGQAAARSLFHRFDGRKAVTAAAARADEPFLTVAEAAALDDMLIQAPGPSPGPAGPAQPGPIRSVAAKPEDGPRRGVDPRPEAQPEASPHADDPVGGWVGGWVRSVGARAGGGEAVRGGAGRGVAAAGPAPPQPPPLRHRVRQAAPAHSAHPPAAD